MDARDRHATLLTFLAIANGALFAGAAEGWLTHTAWVIAAVAVPFLADGLARATKGDTP